MIRALGSINIWHRGQNGIYKTNHMPSVIKILLPAKLHENSSILESIEKSGLRILDTLFEVFAEKNNAFFVFSTLLFDNIAFNSIISKNSSNKFQKCCIYSQISRGY